MKKIKSICSMTVLLTILLMAVSCERKFDGLPLATYPTTPDVFIDGFSSGLYYAAYGTSKVTAFSVDYNFKYEGSASMKFEVPDAGDPYGSYVGGVFGTNPARDLSGYNVLTFWAKATQPSTLIEVGFGNDMGASKYKVTLTNVPVNSNWMQFYVPFPDPSVLKEERGMFFYAAAPLNGRGYTFWIDDVKFEQLGTIAHTRFGMLNGTDSVKNNAEIGDKYNIAGLYATFNLPTGLDQKVGLAPSYFTFTSTNPSVATVDELGNVTVADSGSAVISATVANVDAKGSLTIHVAGKPVAPVVPPPAPTFSSDKVISLYTSVYTNVPVDSWNTHWLYSTTENKEMKIGGDNVMRYWNLNFVGIEFTSQTIDATNMTHFHLDIWTPNVTTNKTFKVKLVDFGANGVLGGDDDSESEVTIGSPPLATQQWVILNIPLSSFSGLLSRSHLAQLVLSGDLPDVYVDNVYFYNNGAPPPAPTTPAPTPTFIPSNVNSVFSDAYTNLTGTDFYPNWGQTTVVSEVLIAGNNTLKYTGLNYQGIQLSSNQNVSAMGYLHLDFWTTSSMSLSVYLISPGPIEKAYSLIVPTSGWTTMDIPLSSFSPVDLTNVMQFKFEGNGDIYIDNILFHK
ncbi:MAG: Ig-like domain-containing protein [Bacteroidota bacterium]